MLNQRLKWITLFIWVILSYPLAVAAEWIFLLPESLLPTALLLMFVTALALGTALAWLTRYTASYTTLKQLRQILCTNADDADSLYSELIIHDSIQRYKESRISFNELHNTLSLLINEEQSEYVFDSIVRRKRQPLMPEDLHSSTGTPQSYRSLGAAKQRKIEKQVLNSYRKDYPRRTGYAAC